MHDMEDGSGPGPPVVDCRAATRDAVRAPGAEPYGGALRPPGLPRVLSLPTPTFGIAPITTHTFFFLLILLHFSLISLLTFLW